MTDAHARPVGRRSPALPLLVPVLLVGAAGLLIDSFAIGQGTPPPATGHLVLEVQGLHYDAGDPVNVRITARNDGTAEVANPLSDPLPQGFRLRDKAGVSHPPTSPGEASPTRRPARLAPGAYFGQVIDLARHFPILKQTGKYELSYAANGVASDPVQVNVIPEFNEESTYTATIKTRLGSMTLDLYLKDAPAHVQNFVDLARQGFYDGLTIHYIRPGEMIATGDPRGNGSGGSGFMVPPEFNERKHLAGTVGMVRLPAPANSGSSQFYICLAPLPERDGKFSVFGQVAEGLPVLQKIAQTPTSGRAKPPYFRPLEPLVIESVVVHEKAAAARKS